MAIRDLAFIFLFFFLHVLSVFGQQVQPTSEVVADSIGDIGAERSTRPVEIIDQKLMQGAARPNFSDGLNTLTGLQSRLEGSPLLSIRGSGSSSRVLALQDGIPLNFSDGVGFNPLFVAKENFDSVALLKGPASSIFGRDAVAGALEFRSEKLEAPKFFLSQGSFNTAQVFVGAPMKSENYSAQVTAYQTHSDGDFEYTVPRQGGVAVRTRNDSETLRSTLLASGKISSLKWKTFNLIARQIGSTPDSIYSAMPSSFNNWGEMSYLGLNSDLSENFEIASRTSYKTLTQVSSPNYNSLTTSFRQGVSGIIKFGDNDIEIFDDASFENFQASYYNKTQPVTINEYGAKAQYVTNGKIVIQPAARFSTTNDGFSPSLGFSGVDSHEIKYFLNYSEGYAPVSVTQLYSISQGFSGNPNLQAEHSAEIDLGVEKSMGEYFAHVEAFARQITNLIQNVAVPGGLTPQNVGTARAYGLEFQGKMNGFVNLGLNLDYLQNREVDTDSPVLLSPNAQASVFVEKMLGDYSLTLQDTQWTSYYDINYVTGQQVQLNGWNTLDFFLKFGLVKNWHGELALLNILDQPRELNVGYPEPQSSFTFTLVGYL